MPQTKYTKEEVSRRAKEIYEQNIRAKVEPGNKGKFLVIDIESGDYEMDESDLTATDRAAAQHPNGVLHIMRIGFPAATRLGVRLTRPQ